MGFQQFLGPARVSIKDSLMYKFEFFAWTIIMPITLVIFYFLWQAAFAYGGFTEIRGMTFSNLVIYYALTIIIATLTYSSVIEDLPVRIKKGKFAIDLVQPMNIIKRYLSEYFGYKLMTLFFQVLPLVVLMLLLVRPSVSVVNLILFVVSVAFACVISFLLWLCIALLAFWMKEVQGVAMAVWGVTNMLRGSVVPLVFFPQAVQTALSYMPFPYMAFVPIQIFLGKLSFAGALGALVIQIFWVVVMLLIAKFMLSRGVKLFTGAGI